MTGEIWQQATGLEFYEVSNLGRVRSIDRVEEFEGRWGLTKRQRVGRVLRLKPKPNGSGGIYWSFYAGKEGGYQQVNRIVCRTFNGDPPSPKHEAAHIDGNTNNNFSVNLIWATPVENAAHKIGHGTVVRGERNGQCRLCEDNIRDIFGRYCGGESPHLIASDFAISVSAVRRIVSGSMWFHVDVGLLRHEAKKQSKLNLEASWLAASDRRQSRGPTLMVK